jgi:genome maintenance exonuclease 1
MFEHVKIDLGYDDLQSVTEESGRRYATPTGTKYPSITTVLSILSKDSIAKWRKRIGEDKADQITFRASQRGTSVHELIEKYINNDSKYLSGYMPNIVANFLSVKDILDDLAGRVDCVAEFDGKISIIDFKTSRKLKRREYIENYFCQEAGYAVMWEERTGMPIEQLVTIIAVDDEDPQIFIETRDKWIGKLIETVELYENTPN